MQFFEFVIDLFNLKVKIRITFEIHFLPFDIIFEPKITSRALKGLMLPLKSFFWFSDILTEFHPHLKKKNRILGFLPKISSNFEISDVDIWPKIWPIGQKFRPKTFVSPIFLPKKFWAKSDHCQRIKCKKTTHPPPLEKGLEGGGGYWSLIPVII